MAESSTPKLAERFRISLYVNAYFGTRPDWSLWDLLKVNELDHAADARFRLTIETGVKLGPVKQEDTNNNKEPAPESLQGIIHVAFVLTDTERDESSKDTTSEGCVAKVVDGHGVEDTYVNVMRLLNSDSDTLPYFNATRALFPDGQALGGDTISFRTWRIQQQLYELVEKVMSPQGMEKPKFLGLKGNEEVEAKIRDCVSGLDHWIYLDALKLAFVRLRALCLVYEAMTIQD
ncbi:hypothetical protein PG987_013088 [Apiospora arundinis]